MKFRLFYPRGNICLVGVALSLIVGCGVASPPGRLADSNLREDYLLPQNSDGSLLDAEDVVTMMLSPEKLTDQAVSAEELAMRKSSLLPLLEDQKNTESLALDSPGLSLADQDSSDGREQLDIRIYDTAVKNQGSRPWCTSFATIAAVENLGRRFFNAAMDLSEIHHFRSYNVYQTSPSLEAGRTKGFIDESLWPYYGQKQVGADSKVRAKLSDSKKIKLTLSDVVASIRAGEPVVINLDVNGSFMNPKSGGIILPGGAKQGGHAITISGVVLDSRVGGGGYFIIKNSWGTSWGNKGYGYVPFNYCSYSYCYAWSISDVIAFDDTGKIRDRIPSVVPAPFPDITPRPQPNPLPTPRPTPVPDTVVDTISAESFKLISSLKDYRGLLGSHFFALEVHGEPKVLSMVRDVTYRVDGFRDFIAVTGDASLKQVLAKDTQSRSYKLWGWRSVEAKATVRLNDGRVVDLKPIVIEL